MNFLPYISDQDVKHILVNLKVNNVCGIDLINHRILEEAASVISKPLTLLFNKSINMGQFSYQWKLANLLPIHKGNETHLVNNYRPISLLSCLGKTFERCVFKHVFNYLHGNRIISINQSGFIPGDSTASHLVSIHHDICMALENHNDVQLIFSDISKALDKVWHAGLFTQNEKYWH